MEIIVKQFLTNFNRAAAYALNQLETKLPPNLYYHGVHHTRHDVVPAAERLVDAYRLSEEDRVVLLTAAWYHDIGFIQQYKDNEAIGAQIAAAALAEFGYTGEQIRTVKGIILATKPPQKPKTLLEAIMVDADLDSLGRHDFIAVAETLRREEAIYLDKIRTDDEWRWEEMQFLSSHRYFTKVQRAYRTPGKLQNFMLLYRGMKHKKTRR